MDEPTHIFILIGRDDNVNDPFITIVLHGLMRQDAMKRIDRALANAPLLMP